MRTRNKFFKLALILVIIVASFFTFASCEGDEVIEECTCENTDGWMIKSYPKENGDGIIHKICSNCGNETDERTIPTLDTERFQYTINADGSTITITEYSGELEAGFIPSQIDGYKVTVIGTTSINCTNLKILALPSGIEKLEKGAIGKSKSIETVIISDTVKDLDSFVGYSYLTEYDHPEMGPMYCLYSYYCESVKNLNVDKNNPFYKSIDGNLYSKDGKVMIQYALGKEETEFITPNGVEEINEEAFIECKVRKTKIYIPKSITSLTYTTISNAGFPNIEYEGTEEEWSLVADDALIFFKVKFNVSQK